VIAYPQAKLLDVTGPCEVFADANRALGHDARRLWIGPGLRRPLRLRKTRKLGSKPGTSANSCVQQPSRFKNDVWTCDFIHDGTTGGRPLKWLTLVDEYTRECLVLHASGSLSGVEVPRILARVIGRRGASTRIRSDNGSEFIGAALVGWLPGVGRSRSRWPQQAPGRMDI
jgi:putative transposase